MFYRLTLCLPYFYMCCYWTFHTNVLHVDIVFTLLLQVLLLDNKKSMSVNIFLKQFKHGNAEIVAMIKEGDVTKIGNERLRGLQKILPESDDVSFSYFRHSILKDNI